MTFSTSQPDSFTLTRYHLQLARRMYVGWQHCETGAPEIDPKRPYGNSDVAGDVHEILTGEFVDGEIVCLTDEQEELYLALHREMKIALQIILIWAGSQVVTGPYIKPDRYNDRSWKYVG